MTVIQHSTANHYDVLLLTKEEFNRSTLSTGFGKHNAAKMIETDNAQEMGQNFVERREDLFLQYT